MILAQGKGCVNFQKLISLPRDFQDTHVNIVEKSFLEVMYLYICGDTSVGKGHKVMISHDCEGSCGSLDCSFYLNIWNKKKIKLQ